MVSISMVIAQKCKQHAYGEGDGDWFGYASTICIKGDYCSRNIGDTGSADLVTYMEGDDDDDGGYDYAPAA